MLLASGAGLLPFVTGLVYCNVIAGCQQAYALDRAREWTEALGAWCDRQPQMTPFAGPCLIHRSEILQLGGDWTEAFAEAREATTRLAPTKDGEAGNAFYQEGELHRVRGALARLAAALHEALRLEGAVLAGEVQVADGLPLDAAHRRPLARAVARVAALRPREARP